MPSTFQLKVTGDEYIANKLERISASAQRSVIRPAANFAWTPVNKDAKSSVPVDTGALKRSIGKKAITYSRSGVVWVGVGARSGAQYTRVGPDGNVRKPWKYAHIVEFGSEDTPPEGFLRTAFMRQRANAQARLYAKTWVYLQKEIAKP